MGFEDSLRAAKDRERWKGIVATPSYAEAGYLLLVTSYWLLIHLLVTDSFTGY